MAQGKTRGAPDDLFEATFDQYAKQLVRGIPAGLGRWFALVPRSTMSMAQSVASRGSSVESAVELLTARGLVESSPATSSSKYIVLNERGRGVLRREFVPDDAKGLSKALGIAGSVVRETSSGKTKKKGSPLQRWAQLAQSEDMADELDREVERAARKKEAASLRRWIDTAVPFARLFRDRGDRRMEHAVHRANRRLALIGRQARDRRHLGNFLVRDEQVAALEELVRGESDSWALHLIGAGGVGKTMLLRYLTGELALPEHWDLAVARVDFDYLNADYPRLDPGLLLWSFGEELREHDRTGRVRSMLKKAGHYFDNLRRDLLAPDATPMGDPTTNSWFVAAVQAYIDALRAVERPVVLVLDTCEELAKVRPDGTVPEAVRATFRILEALRGGPETLHGLPPDPNAGLPNLRVLFAGRRPLAR
ncbi:MAG: ATP-binding protein, partial [Planctomycetota bacterium]